MFFLSGLPDRFAVEQAEGRILTAPCRVERFGRRPTEPFELLNIRIRIKILSQFRKFHKNSSEIQKFEDLSTYSKLFIEILKIFHWNWCKILQKLLKNRDFCWNFSNNAMKKFDKNLRRFWASSGAKVWQSCGVRKTLQNEYLDAKIGVDTAENEPSEVLAEESEKSSVSNFWTKTRRPQHDNRRSCTAALCLSVARCAEPIL